jgi:hypothetical protein
VRTTPPRPAETLQMPAETNTLHTDKHCERNLAGAPTLLQGFGGYTHGCASARLLTDKTLHLRSASVRTYTFFTTGFPRFLSIRGERGLLALNQVLI